MKGSVNVNTVGVVPSYVSEQHLYDERSQSPSPLHDNFLNIMSPDMFKAYIELLRNAILNQIQNNGPQNPMEFLKWLSLSNSVDSQESDRLNKLLLDGKEDEFYNQIPRILNYESDMKKYYFIKNNKVYVSETFADHYMSQFEIDSKIGRGDFIFRDNLPQLKPKIPMVPPVSGALDSVNLALHNLISNLFSPKAVDLFEGFFKYFSSLFQEEVNRSTATSASYEEVESADEDLFSSTETVFEPKIKYIFYLNTYDLINSTGNAAIVKALINKHNSAIVPMDKVQHSEIWDFYKTHWYKKTIEKTPHSFINFFTFHKLPLNQLTISQFVASMFSQAFEYWEEYVFLTKAKIGMDFLLCKDSKLNLYTKYSSEEINESIECFLEYRLRQILYYNSLFHIDQPKFVEYLPNMFNNNILYEELLENIIFVESQIFEAFWTINFIQKFISLNDTLNIYNFEDEEQRMEFFNLVYEQYQKQILDKYRDVYSIRREFIISRAIPCALDYHLFWNNHLLIVNNDINFADSKFTKTNFNKTSTFQPVKPDNKGV